MILDQGCPTQPAINPQASIFQEIASEMDDGVPLQQPGIEFGI